MIPLLLPLLLAPADLATDLRSDDPATRLRAVQQVERLGTEGAPDEAYLAPLAKLLADASLQTRGLAALALARHVVASKERVPEGVVGPLLLALRDDNPHIGAYCGRALLVLGERAWPTVQKTLEPGQARPRPRAERLAALEGCRRLAAITELREPIDTLLWAQLGEADEPVRERAFVVLKLVRAEYRLPPVRTPERLLPVLRSPDERFRALAFRQLIALEQQAFPLLLDLLHHEDRIVRVEAGRVVYRLLVLGVHPEPKLTPRLLLAVERADLPEVPDLRDDLAKLARSQWPPRDSVFFEVDLVMRWLSRPDTLPALRTAWEEADPARRRPIPDTQLASTAEIETQAGLLQSPQASTRRAAARALRTGLRPTSRMPAVVLAALHLGIAGKDDWVRIDCTYALAACGPSAEPLIVAMLQASDPEVQYRAAEAVIIMVHSHGIYPSKTEPHLKQLRSSPDARLYEIAGKALATLASPPQERRPTGGAP
jgi:HEAT repeat protein